MKKPRLVSASGAFLYLFLVAVDFRQNLIARNTNNAVIIIAIRLSSVLLFAMSGAADVMILEVSAVEPIAKTVNIIASGFHLFGMAFLLKSLMLVIAS